MKRPGTAIIGALLLAAPAAGAEPEPAFHPEMAIKRPTRLDWEFVAADFGRQAARVPRSYESARQRYQLFVPPEYRAERSWPLFLFISPGDDPLGWRAWQKLCEDRDVFFCAAYAAGNNTPPGQRIRLILDMFDDVRRRYRIDPDRTYLAGFGGGGRLACTLAFAMPEYFGGVVAIGGTNPLHCLDYLRHRVEDRLSVALVAGETDPERRELEVYRAPLFRDLGIRSRLWLVPRSGHALPPEDVLLAVCNWLEEDLPRRRQDAKQRPGLAVSTDEALTDRARAERLLEAARAELYQPDRVFRGAAMLLGIVSRWGDTDAANKARALLKEMRDDPVRLKRLTEQSAAEERRTLSGQARALERFGQVRQARDTWELLSRSQAGKAEGDKAAAEVKRLDALLAATPYLGVHFEGETTVVRGVVRRGPADRAGLRKGDRVVQLGGAATPSLVELRQALQTHKPGDRLPLHVRREGQTVTLTVEVGAVPHVVKE